VGKEIQRMINYIMTGGQQAPFKYIYNETSNPCIAPPIAYKVGARPWPSIECLQMGQSLQRLSHSSMHFVWKVCTQGKLLTVSPGRIFSRQIRQLSSFSPSASVKVRQGMARMAAEVAPLFSIPVPNLRGNDKKRNTRSLEVTISRHAPEE